ncbi:MAG: hypothetical protein R3A46_08395 [Thermomicrobiales bacterium]
MERRALLDGLAAIHEDVGAFSRAVLPARSLRSYQLAFARAVAGSVVGGSGETFAAVFSRQSGKDEGLAQLLAFLLSRYRLVGGSIVVATPALKPQGLIARDRLLARLDSPLTRDAVRVRDGTTVELGRASVRFLSAARAANSRGNTASLLLVANESQDIEPDVWDAVFAPMAAASNATTLFLGTVWTSDTLLSRQMRMLRDLESSDGRKRLFRVDWREVARHVPEYGTYVRRQIQALGANHPFIRTEYELRELDGDGRLFPAERIALFDGGFPPLRKRGEDDGDYALLIDVAGEVEDGIEGEALRRAQPRRDSTAVTVVRVVSGKPADYRIVARYLWTGIRHDEQHRRIVKLAERVWRARKVVVDATGIGAGLASFLRSSLGERVVHPFVFSSASKSRLGWDFLSMIDSGRLTCFDPNLADDPEQQRLDRIFRDQMAACRYSVLPGPGKLMRWSVEDPALHDDLLISAALVAVLDGLDWSPRTAKGRAGGI